MRVRVAGSSRTAILAGVAVVALLATACGTPQDDRLAERLAAVASLGCEGVDWEATSDATSDLPDGGRTHTLAADGDQAACGFGTHSGPSTEADGPPTPAAVVVIAARSGSDPPFTEGDILAHAAKQWAAGGGRAEATNALQFQEHILVVAVNEDHTATLHPDALLRAARQDLGVAE